MIRKLAAVALIGSIALLAVSRLDDLRNVREWRIEKRHVVKLAHQQDHDSEVRQVRRSSALNVQDVSGAYEFSDAGNVFGKFPWSAHVVLNLKETGRYILDVDLTLNGDHKAETVEGDYRIEGDRIVLVSASGSEDADGRLEDHALRFEHGRLVPDVRRPARAALSAAGVGELAFDRLK